MIYHFVMYPDIDYHTYGQDEFEMDKIIFTTEDGFRIAENYLHDNNETIHQNCVLIKNKCIYCGHETQSWCTKQFYLMNFKNK